MDDTNDKNKPKNLAEKARSAAEKLQNLPEEKKKIVFFAIIVIAILVIGTIQIQIMKKNFFNLNKSFNSMNLPDSETKIFSSSSEGADILDNSEASSSFVESNENFLIQEESNF